MKNRTMIFLCVGALTVCMLAGCQATPQNGVVVRKDLQQMLSIASDPQDKQGSVSDYLGVPDRYETHFTDSSGTVEVTADADVSVPDVDDIPIIRVKAQPFSQDIINKLIDTLFDDAPLYESGSLSELTKTDITELLTKLKVKKSELEEQGIKPEKSGSTDDKQKDSSDENVVTSSTGNQLDQVIETIALYEGMLKDAPDEKTFVETTGTLTNVESSAYTNVAQLCDEGGMSSLFVVNSDSANHFYAQYVNRKDFDVSTGMYYSEESWNDMTYVSDYAAAQDLEYPTMTQEQAQTLADQFLEQHGIDYLACALNEKVIGGSSAEYGSAVRIGNLLKGYRLEYVREVNSIPLTYSNVRYAHDDSDMNAVFSWAYERMTLIMDDSGIVELVWESPYRLFDTVVEDTALLPFDKIRDVFEKMIVINSVDEADNGADFSITDVRLGFTRITEQNSLKQGLLIPVWDFFGSKTVYFKDRTGKEDSYTVREAGQSLLTINAIDGSIIDREKGY